MAPARRWPALLSAAVLAVLAAVLAVVLPATLASAATRSAATTRVGASHPVMILTVGVPRPVSAGDRRCGPAPKAQIVSGACVAAEDAGANGGTSVFRTPRLGQGDSELGSGLDPANHVEGDQSAYVGTENVARDYANLKIGGFENGYVRYDMAPEFDDDFSLYKFRYVTAWGESGFEWQIPAGMIDRFNELTVSRSWVPWVP